jgi:3,4-dihydroxy-2-butanone 4-phosphate synthase
MMTRYASGIITVPMTAARLHHLQLELMVPDNRESFQTAFLRVGDQVNLEVDMLARYVARQLAVGSTHLEKKL